MTSVTRPVVNYFATVLAVMATATAAAFALHAVAARAQRSWDADIDRIVARHQENKQRIETAALAAAQPHRVSAPDHGFVTAELISGTFDDAEFQARHTARGQKTRPQNATGKKSNRRAVKRYRYVPAAFVTFPRFAAVTTSTILRLR